MPKRTLKLLIWLAVSGIVVGLTAGALIGLGRVWAHFNSGADPATALNLIPTVPSDLDDRLSWRPDAPQTGDLRPMESPTRRQISDAFLRAWAQLDISYELERPYGLGTYFTGPALTSVTRTLTETVAAGWDVSRSTLESDLELTFYSDDGSIVALTAHEYRVAQRLQNAQTGLDQVVDGRGQYQALMLLEDGNWRIRDWRRVGQGARSGQIATADPLPGMVGVRNRALVLDGQPFQAAGVNYYPPEATWFDFWPNYDPAYTARDLARIQALALNTVRIFVPYFDVTGIDVTGFDVTGDAAGETTQERANDQLLADLVDFLDQAEAADIKVIVTLFDHRTDHHPSFWAADARYIEAVVAPLARHPAILAWDLKNEADLDLGLNGQALLDAWLLFVAETVRHHDPHHLLTVGWFSPEAAANPTVAAATDLVSYHYWDAPDDYAARVNALRATLPQKPLMLQEFAFTTWRPLLPARWTEPQQARYFRALLQAHRSADAAVDLAGYLVWTLYDFESIGLPQFNPYQRARQAHMGVLRTDGTAKPAAELLAPGADLSPER